ncbi:MAG: ATP-dependent Clp protease ATP-binding subunit [Bacilli bacterium]|nr:ATP-dependent Clp protease ATP-binding subunit [Bacilli bacterium]
MFSVLESYGTDLTKKTYITNPAIAREDEIRRAMVILLTPEKSALLVGKPGIGKTAIVEGIAYLIQRNEVPDALKGYRIISLNSTSLLGKIVIDGRETLIATLLVEELKKTEKTILFIDEIHTLIGGNTDGPMDLANILKAGLDRGDIKVIGATTTIEYETYILRDRAFLRRFEKVDVLEPDKETTVKILMGTIPKLENQTGVKIKYNPYVTELLVKAIVMATDEFKRVYGIAAMYPDVALSVFQQVFSNALYENKQQADILDFYKAIMTSRKIYPDSIIKELNQFRETFKDLCQQENVVLPVVTLEDLEEDQTQL